MYMHDILDGHQQTFKLVACRIVIGMFKHEVALPPEGVVLVDIHIGIVMILILIQCFFQLLNVTKKITVLPKPFNWLVPPFSFL